VTKIGMPLDTMPMTKAVISSAGVSDHPGT
jgi:hypothetical protein